MNSKLAGLSVWVAVCGAWPGAVDAQFISVPPVTYSGVVKDYALRPFDQQYKATVYVRRVSADRTLLAKAETANPQNGINYALSIPLVSQSNVVTTAAAVGEKVSFDVDDGRIIWGNRSVQTIGNPACYTLNITLMTDSNGNGVADEYEALIQALMAAYGIAGAYDPNADYNNDGISNYQHYLAGTSPFAGLTPSTGGGAGDRVTIDSMMNVQMQSSADTFSISFLAVPDKLYSVLSLTELGTSWGTADTVDFATSPGGDGQTFFSADASGLVTLYIHKDGASRYYRLRME